MQTHRWTQNDTEKPSYTDIMGKPGIMAKPGDGGNHRHTHTHTNTDRQTDTVSTQTHRQTVLLNNWKSKTK